MSETMSVQEYREKMSTGKTKRQDHEHQEQVYLFNWIAIMERQYPELSLLFAIPNGGQRHVLVAMKMKAEGVKSGVPDLFLPVARGNYHGLFIEMKAGKNKTSEKQNVWIENLQKQGYMVEVCYGSDEAQDLLVSYLEQPIYPKMQFTGKK